MTLRFFLILLVLSFCCKLRKCVVNYYKTYIELILLLLFLSPSDFLFFSTIRILQPPSLVYFYSYCI